MATFEPRVVLRGWACPCQDAHGQAALLVLAATPEWDATARMGERLVENYTCDQNGDRWQRIVGTDGAATWQYLGRPADV